MDIMNYIMPELIVVSVVLYFIGMAIKKAETVKDNYIPYILGLVGILPQYRKSGLSAYVMTMLQDIFADENIEYVETNLNLETNANIQAQWNRCSR